VTPQDEGREGEIQVRRGKRFFVEKNYLGFVEKGSRKSRYDGVEGLARFVKKKG